MSKKSAIYNRVSTENQSTENQVWALREYADRCDYEVAKVYEDQGLSGSKGINEREALKQLMKDAVARKFEIVLVWSIDRLGRSLKNLIEIMNELNCCQIGIYFSQQSIDTNTASGRMVFNIFGSLAEFERNMIRDRVISGLNRARKNGKKLSRKSIITDNVKQTIKVLREKGMSNHDICKTVGCGIGSYYSAINISK